MILIAKLEPFWYWSDISRILFTKLIIQNNDSMIFIKWLLYIFYKLHYNFVLSFIIVDHWVAAENGSFLKFMVVAGFNTVFSHCSLIHIYYAHYLVYCNLIDAVPQQTIWFQNKSTVHMQKLKKIPLFVIADEISSKCKI